MIWKEFEGKEGAVVKFKSPFRYLPGVAQKNFENCQNSRSLRSNFSEGHPITAPSIHLTGLSTTTRHPTIPSDITQVTVVTDGRVQ
jgi:hypothetical protein